MSEFDSVNESLTALRLIVPHITRHLDGSLAFAAYGPKSMGTKVAKSDKELAVGKSVETSEQCFALASGIVEAADRAKLACSGVYFAFLKEKEDDQPETNAGMLKAIKHGLDNGMDCWLSKRGKLTVGHNATGNKRGGNRPEPKMSKDEQSAIAAFLKA